MTTTSGFAEASGFTAGVSAGFCGRTSVNAPVAGPAGLVLPGAGLAAAPVVPGAALEVLVFEEPADEELTGLSLGLDPVPAGASAVVFAAGFAPDQPPLR